MTVQDKILAQIEDLAPGYKVTPTQMWSINRAKEENTANLLKVMPIRFNDTRIDMARYLGVDPSYLLPQEVMAAMRDFDKEYHGQSGDDKGLVNRMGLESVLSLGKRLGAKDDLSLIDHLFLGFLGRLPRSGGRDYYQSRLSSGGEGNSLIDIVYEIYNSPEATSRRLNE